MESCLMCEILSSWEAKLGEGAGQRKESSMEELEPISRSALLTPALPGLPCFLRWLAHSLTAAKAKATQQLKLSISFKTESSPHEQPVQRKPPVCF